MNPISEKVYLSLKMPEEGNPISDDKRILLALETLGYSPVTMPLAVLRRLYPLCRIAGFDVTVTLVRRQYDWAVAEVEPGDTRSHHYGLAVDYGSTTIVMQLVDLNSGAVIHEEKQVNGQTAYGTDILTRITYAMESAEHVEHLHAATATTFASLLASVMESSREAKVVAVAA